MSFITLFRHSSIINKKVHQIGAQITQTGTALRFTGKNAHAIMVMLRIVSAPISIPLFQTSAPAGVIFLQYRRHVLCGMALPLKQGPWKPAVLRESRFSTITNFTGGNSLKKENSSPIGNQLPTKKKIPHPLPEHHRGCSCLCLLLYPSDRSGPCNRYVV